MCYCWQAARFAAIGLNKYLSQAVGSLQNLSIPDLILSFRAVWPLPAPEGGISPFVFAHRPDFAPRLPPGGGATGSASLVEHVRFKGVLDVDYPEQAPYKSEPASIFIESQHIQHVPDSGLKIHVYPSFLGFWEHKRSQMELDAFDQALTPTPAHHRGLKLGVCSGSNVCFSSCRFCAVMLTCDCLCYSD